MRTFSHIGVLSNAHLIDPRRTGTRGRLKSVPAPRPLTGTLDRPSHSDIEVGGWGSEGCTAAQVPNIRYHSKPKNMKARMQHKQKTEARKKLFSLPLPPPSDTVSRITREFSPIQPLPRPCPPQVLEPCLSCGRNDQPERLHTHRYRAGGPRHANTAVSPASKIVGQSVEKSRGYHGEWIP